MPKPIPISKAILIPEPIAILEPIPELLFGIDSDENLIFLITSYKCKNFASHNVFLITFC